MQRVDDWYPQKTVTLGAADGTRRSVEVDEHPYPTAEAVRRATVMAELEQATGRGRGVRRGADNPLEVTVYGNVVLPGELATLTEWTPSFDDGMLGELGVALENGGDAGQVAGKSQEAIKKERQRSKERSGTNPYSNIFLYENVPNLPARARFGFAQYRRKGPGRSETSIKFDPMRIKDIGVWLLGNIGEHTLTALHRPDLVRGTASLDHMIRCQITGVLNFGCAPPFDCDWGHAEDSETRVIQSPVQGKGRDTPMDDMELLDQIKEAATDEEWIGTLLAIGADAEGAQTDEVERIAARANEALAMAADDSLCSRRRAAAQKIGEGLCGAIIGLVIAGQRVVNECQAMAAAEHANVH